MTMTESMGYAVGLSIGGTNCEFVSIGIKETIPIVEDDGIRGNRSRNMERVALGNISVAGPIVLQPSPAELTAVLPFLLQNSSGFSLTDQLQNCTVVVTTATSTYTYVGRFTKGTFSGSPGQKITLTLDFVGKTCVVSAGGAAGTPDVVQRPYMFYDMGSGLTIASTAYQIDKFELAIDNKIVPTYMSGQTATDLEPTDRVITLSCQSRFVSEASLLATGIAGPVIGTPLTGSIAFTNGSNTLSFTMGALVMVPETVTVPGRQHLRLPLNFHCYKVATTLELVTANS